MSSESPSKPSTPRQRGSRKRSRRGVGDMSSPGEEDGDFEPGVSPRGSKQWKESGSGLRRSHRQAVVRLPFSTPSKSTVTTVGTQLRHLLSLPKAYRWCCCEWFYSDIDRAILGGDNDFCKYLREAFPPIRTRQLTRCQWSQIRRLMGKPRRCSSQFFAEERHTLHRQRAKIRLLQRREVTDEELAHFKDVPEEIPPPLVLGTTVTAWQWSSNHHRLLTGRVEAVDLTKGQYHIIFDRPGVASGSVSDIDIMSTDDVDLLPVSSFIQPQRRALSWFSVTNEVTPPSHFSTPLASQSAYWRNDPLIGGSPSGSKLMTSETLGGFPVRFLRLVVRLSKILTVKKEQIERLSEMNTKAEKLLSFEESFLPEFQAQYASSVLDLERLNKSLNICLQDVQEYMPQVFGLDGVADGAGAAINSQCDKEAEQMVVHLSKKDLGFPAVKNDRLKQLVIGLTSLLFQVQMLSEHSSLPSHELQGLADSITDLKLSKIDPTNRRVFEDQVEVHMAHIEAGLSQLGNLKAFEHCV